SQHIHLYTDPATTKNYTLSLHDALPICKKGDVQKDAREHQSRWGVADVQTNNKHAQGESHSATRRHQDGSTSPSIKKDHRENREDRKSTRLNSSHVSISYAVFCLKKKTI